MRENSSGRERESVLVVVALRKLQQPRHPATPTSGLRDRKAPKQTCAMRTGSFHRTISPLGISRCPPACPTPHLNPSSGSMDIARVSSVVKSPDLAVAIRATFSDHQIV